MWIFIYVFRFKTNTRLSLLPELLMWLPTSQIWKMGKFESRTCEPYYHLAPTSSMNFRWASGGPSWLRPQVFGGTVGQQRSVPGFRARGIAKGVRAEPWTKLWSPRGTILVSGSGLTRTSRIWGWETVNPHITHQKHGGIWVTFKWLCTSTNIINGQKGGPSWHSGAAT